MVNDFHLHGFVLGRFLHFDAVLDVSSLFTVDLDHSEIGFKHPPLVCNSFLKIRLVSSEANSSILFVDEVHKNIRKILIRVKFN